MLKIYLFGRIRLEHGQTGVVAHITPTVQALLAYLLIRPGHSYSRDALLELGWGDRPQDQARSCLNTALWRLRNILEPEGVRRGAYLLTSQTGDVGFNWDGDFWTDTGAFESTAGPVLSAGRQVIDDGQAGQLEQAIALYHGDLLEGLYQDWALEERERVRAMYLNCLGRLLEYYRWCGRLDQAITAGQQILRLDPLREEVHRDLIAIFIQNGQRALAAHQYELCCAALQNELGIGPMPETRALYEQAVQQPGSPAQVSSLLPALPDDLLQATERLTHILDSLDSAREEVRRTLTLLKRASGQKNSKTI